MTALALKIKLFFQKTFKKLFSRKTVEFEGTRLQREKKRQAILNDYKEQRENIERQLESLDNLKKRVNLLEEINFSNIDEKVTSLQKIVVNANGVYKFPNLNEKFQRFEKELHQLVDYATSKRFKQREADKRRKEQIKENQLKKQLTQLELSLIHNDLKKALALMTELERQIDKKSQKLARRLEAAKKSFADKKRAKLIARQNEIIKRQDTEVKKIQNSIQEVEETGEVSEPIIVKEDEQGKKQRVLDGLLIKKSNWKEFETVLNEHTVKELYHFTDQSNISSIIKHGGLYSWSYADRNGIEILKPGGNSLSRDLDRKHGLEDYVHLSFVKDHPMRYVTRNEGRLIKPVVLTVDTEVCYLLNTTFSNMNAAGFKHMHSDSIDFFKTISFDLFKSRYLDLNVNEKRYYQAEVMVKTWIPVKYLKNINLFTDKTRL